MPPIPSPIKGLLLSSLFKKRSLFSHLYEIKSGAFGAKASMIRLGRRITVVRKPSVISSFGVTEVQLREIESYITAELHNIGQAMVREAKFLAPTPATVPRVTVPSLAGTDRAGSINPHEKTDGEKKKASELMTSHLGKGRMLLLSKHGFIDSSAPSKDTLSSYGGLKGMKKAGRRRAKSLITSHIRGTARDTAHNSRRIYMPIAGINIKVSDYKRKMGIAENKFIRGRSYAATGNLKRSIKYRVQGLVLEVYSACPYAVEIEYGWGLRGQRYPHPPLQEAGILGSIIRDNHTKFIPLKKRNIRMAGARAQPFMYPAYLKYGKTLPNKINNCIKKVLTVI
jgi:hypothetical protein